MGGPGRPGGSLWGNRFSPPLFERPAAVRRADLGEGGSLPPGLLPPEPPPALKTQEDAMLGTGEMEGDEPLLKATSYRGWHEAEGVERNAGGRTGERLELPESSVPSVFRLIDGVDLPPKEDSWNYSSIFQREGELPESAGEAAESLAFPCSVTSRLDRLMDRASSVSISKSVSLKALRK